jgi:hypothetical protein
MQGLPQLTATLGAALGRQPSDGTPRRGFLHRLRRRLR